MDPGGAAQRPADDEKREHESGWTGRPPSSAVLGRCARVVATSCCPARDRAIRYGRGRPLHPPTAPGRTWTMRIPGPQGPGQAPEHAPPQESRAGIQHARLPGQFDSCQPCTGRESDSPGPAPHHARCRSYRTGKRHLSLGSRPKEWTACAGGKAKSSGPFPQSRLVAAAAAGVRSNASTLRHGCTRR